MRACFPRRLDAQNCLGRQRDELYAQVERRLYRVDRGELMKVRYRMTSDALIRSQGVISQVGSVSSDNSRELHEELT
jgi:hypothetical protein